MAKGKINLIGGKILIDQGKVQLCRCCGVPCEFCSGATPRTITVVFDGITYCECSYNRPGPPITSCEMDVEPNVSPNGTFVLTQTVANPCLWRKVTALTSGHVNYYPSTDCTGSPVSTTLHSHIVEFEVFTGGLINFNAYYSSTSTPSSASVYTFSHNESSPGCPGSLGPITNGVEHCAYDATDLYDASNYYAGTATVEPG